MNTENTSPLVFCNEIAYLLGIIPRIAAPPTPIKGGWKIETSKVNLLKNNLPLIWVMADFVEQTMVGSTRLPILRMVPVRLDSGNLEHSMQSLHYYVPVQRRRIKQFGTSIHARWEDNRYIYVEQLLLFCTFARYMENNFNYVLVSEEDNGMKFFNTCNVEMDFTSEPYEVCMQDMIFSLGGWDNVRPEYNYFDVKFPNGDVIRRFIPPGLYPTPQLLIEAINVQLTGDWVRGLRAKFVFVDYKPAQPQRYWRAAGNYEIKKCTYVNTFIMGDWTMGSVLGGASTFKI